MSKLDDYARLSEQKKQMTASLVRANGPWKLGPTNRGGIFFKLGDKDIKNDISIKELREIRDLIECFLNEVVDC